MTSWRIGNANTQRKKEISSHFKQLPVCFIVVYWKRSWFLLGVALHTKLYMLLTTSNFYKVALIVKRLVTVNFQSDKVTALSF